MDLLEDIIASELPAVVADVDEQLFDCRKELEGLGEPTDTPDAQRNYFLSCKWEYMKLLQDGLNGKYHGDFYAVKENRLRAQMRFKCDEYRNTLMEGDENDWMGSIEDLKQLILENRGPELAVFAPYNVFGNIVRETSKKWKQPRDELCDAYVQLLKRISEDLIGIFKWRGKMAIHFKQEIHRVIANVTKEVKPNLMKLLEKEENLFTQNNDFQETLKKKRMLDFKDVEEKMRSKITYACAVNILQSSKLYTESNEDAQAREMMNALDSYIEVAQKRYCDNVPMELEYGLVQKYMIELETVLSNVSDKQMEMVLSESPQIVAKRKAVRARLETLEKSRAEIYSFY